MKLTESEIRSIVESTARPEVVEKLFPILEGLSYMFIGGFAVSLQTGGKRRVSMNDLDIALDASSVEELKSNVGNAGFRFNRQNRFAGAFWMIFDAGVDQKMDVRIIGDNDEYFDLALAASERLTYHGMTLKVISKPYLLTDKINAGREKDYRDVLYLLKECSPEEIKRATKLIKTYVPNRIDDFRELINDMKFSNATIDVMYPTNNRGED